MWIKHGKKAGRAEVKTVIARAMKAKEMKISNIADITGLTLEQIESL